MGGLWTSSGPVGQWGVTFTGFGPHNLGGDVFAEIESYSHGDIENIPIFGQFSSWALPRHHVG